MRRGNAFYNATAGISGLVVSVLALTLSAALLLGPKQSIDLDELRQSTIDQCQAAAQSEGFLVTSKPAGLELKMSGVTEHRVKLLTSTLVLQACTGLTLSTFCMGECLDDRSAQYQGIIMELQYNEPDLK